MHGLGADVGMNWSYLSPKLGYCVFALTYGLHPLAAPCGAPGGTIPIQDSAKEFKAFVDRVLRETRAPVAAQLTFNALDPAPDRVLSGS